jgi:hypothetical protein
MGTSLVTFSEPPRAGHRAPLSQWPTTWRESSVRRSTGLPARGQAMKPLERPPGGAKSTRFKAPD